MKMKWNYSIIFIVYVFKIEWIIPLDCIIPSFLIIVKGKLLYSRIQTIIPSGPPSFFLFSALRGRRNERCTHLSSPDFSIFSFLVTVEHARDENFHKLSFYLTSWLPMVPPHPRRSARPRFHLFQIGFLIFCILVAYATPSRILVSCFNEFSMQIDIKGIPCARAGM